MGGRAMSTDKVSRVVIFFVKLMKGEKIYKADFAKTHNISERSVDRDIEDLRNILSELHSDSEIVYDKSENVYYMTRIHDYETNSTEVITILKILLGTRSLRIDEMQRVVKATKLMLNPVERKETSDAIYDEMNSYIPPVHNKPILETINHLNQVILKRLVIKIDYTKNNGVEIQRTIVPLIIIFSEFYFYLIGFRDDKKFTYPAFFRIDRIKNILVMHKTYSKAIYQSYNAAGMKNCLQFMYAGELLIVKVKCKNFAVEAFKDRLTNNWLIEDNGDYKIFGAKIFGEGFIRWALSQGNAIEILEPEHLRRCMIEEIKKLNKIYRID